MAEEKDYAVGHAEGWVEGYATGFEDGYDKALDDLEGPEDEDELVFEAEEALAN